MYPQHLEAPHLQATALLHKLTGPDTGLQRHQAAICGGFARDLAHDAVPNDIDVVVVGASDDVANVIVASMVALGYTQTAHYGNDYTHVLHDLREVLEFSIDGGLDVDILISNHVTIAAHIRQHDCNLNMYGVALVPEEFAHGVTLSYPEYLGPKVSRRFCALQWFEEPTPERRQHMERIAHMLGWAVPITPTKEQE